MLASLSRNALLMVAIALFLSAVSFLFIFVLDKACWCQLKFLIHSDMMLYRDNCVFFPKTCATWAFISIERCGYRLLDDLQWQWPTSVAIDDGHHCGESAESLFLAVASVALQQFLRHSLWNWSPDTLKFKMHHDLDDPVKRKYVGLDATLNKHF